MGCSLHGMQVQPHAASGAAEVQPCASGHSAQCFTDALTHEC